MSFCLKPPERFTEIIVKIRAAGIVVRIVQNRAEPIPKDRKVGMRFLNMEIQRRAKERCSADVNVSCARESISASNAAHFQQVVNLRCDA
jgi:hypothetical protein